MCKFFAGLHASITKRFRLLLEFIKMFLISSILDKRLEKQCWTLQQCWTFTTLARFRCQFCKWCKYRYGKTGKKRVHPLFGTRLYDLFLKVYFSENWFLQSFTNYLRLTLVFMWTSALRKKFNFCFSRVFC